MKINEATINEYPWLLFKVFGVAYAVSSKAITAITILPDQVTVVPDKAFYIRGLMELRGGHIKLIDMRALLGVTSLKDDNKVFIQMLNERKQDHINWVTELERCVAEDCEFKLATDSSKCELGLWHNSYVAKSAAIQKNLDKLSEPHRKIHTIALDIEREKTLHTDAESLALANANHIERAKQLRDVILELLDSTITLYQQEISEMVIVFEHQDSNEEPYAVIVDEVLSVDEITLLEGNNTNNSVFRKKFINGIGKSTKSKDIVLLLDYLSLAEKDD